MCKHIQNYVIFTCKKNKKKHQKLKSKGTEATYSRETQTLPVESKLGENQVMLARLRCFHTSIKFCLSVYILGM